MKDHISRQQFLLEFFGSMGRELGDPLQHFTENPMEMFPFMEECAKQKKPSFISVQPRFRHHSPRKTFGIYGIEKLFFDFDYGIKSDKLTERQIINRRKKMEAEIRIFLNNLTKIPQRRIIPLVVKTRKGYHVYIYFDHIYEIDNNEDFWKKVYGVLYERFVKNNNHKFKFADTTSKMDIARLCRIPTSIHEKNGKECIVLDEKMKPTKFRSIAYYRMYGLKREDLQRAVELVRVREEKRKKDEAQSREEKRNEWELKGGFVGKIRPCFQVRMDAGEMEHSQRRALCNEAFFAGYDTPEKMIELFKCFHDWDGDKSNSTCRYQVEYWFSQSVKNDKCKAKPYRCSTIMDKGWCLGNECQNYKRRKEYAKTKRKET